MKKRILIIRLSGIGDVIETLPVLSALRKAMPEAYIAWLVSEKACGILKDNPYLDEILVLKKGARNYVSSAREIAGKRFDIVLDPQSQFRSGVLALLSGAGKRIGFARGVSKEPNSIFMNERVKPLATDVHVVDRDLSLLNALGVKSEKIEFKIEIRPEEKTYVDAFLGEKGLPGNKRLVGLCLAGSMRNKKWPNEKWAELAERVRDVRNLVPLLIWGPREYAAVEEIMKLSQASPVIAPPTHLKQLADLLSRCSIVVSNDSGPMHLSVAMGTPTIGLHGPSDPLVNGPYRNWSISVMGERIGALDCYAPEKRKLRCRKFRKCGRNECMSLISPEEVFKKVWDILYAEKNR